MFTIQNVERVINNLILMKPLILALTLPAFFIIYPPDITHVQLYSFADIDVAIQTTCHRTCTSPVLFINLHDNENTSVEAATVYLDKTGGSLVQLKHLDLRNICINLQDQGYTFDPNRIFTPAGVQATLSGFDAYSSEADTLVTRFANTLLNRYVTGKKLIIALHNNTDSLYSILSYIGSGSEAPNAAEVYINAAMDPDDFIYTTHKPLFNYLAAQQVNVILQNEATVFDDGSLSVYAGRNNLPYINVEAEHGHLEEQLQMLKILSPFIENLLRETVETKPGEQKD